MDPEIDTTRAVGRPRPVAVLAGLAVGAVVVLGWLAAGPGRDDPAPGPAAGPPHATAGRPARLTDPEFKRRVIPPDAELRDLARRLPAGQRQLWGWDPQRRKPLGWVMPRHDPDVFPVFTGQGDVAGIAVAGIGLVARAEFEDPAVDLEDVARRRWGASYDRMVG
jgi:hypothetical protein